MVMKYNGIVQRKLALLDRYLLELHGNLKDVDFAGFRDNWAMQRMSERVLQVMVELVIDIAERVIAIEKAGPVASSAEAIEKLVELGVIKSAEPYAKMVRFRNFIVHQYEEIDPAIIFDIAKNRLDDFRLFRDEIDQA